MRVRQSKEVVERRKLEPFSEYDNRPFVRIKEDKFQDNLDYKEKHIRLEEERLEACRIVGESVKLHIWSGNTIINKTGMIKDWSVKEDGS